ncbi:unnamed protein product, partial [Aureobasidium uvarum]
MGWKDILRPIRDGLRDNLPSKKPHQNPENENRRREDTLRGFTYFDSFCDIDGWRPEQAYSFQRANTPLLSRPTFKSDQGQAKITLIHDYSGNYQQYEDIHGPPVDQPSYSCEYLQAIDTFVYFSHKLVCIPPPSWTNVLHRNGVKSLGTFLVEPQSRDISKMVQRTSSRAQGWNYTLADQLTRIANYYGFDGWLINIEKTFPIADWSLSKLEGFLEQLRSSFDDGCVIWYDSLTSNNRIDYQNALTGQNALLAKAAGSILTNYAWSPDTAAASKALALQNGINPVNILYGIDVWAQSSERSVRETWPRDIGGGTGTGLGVAKLAELGLSAGIFGPAWPYEHFTCLSDSKAVENSMWTGVALPETLRCGCSSKNRHSIQGYMTYPILRNAQEFPAGSDTFFYTDFSQAFEATTNSDQVADKSEVRASLASQSILPRPSIHPNVQQDIYSQIESCPSRLSLYMPTLGKTASAQRALRLFKLSMPATLVVAIMSICVRRRSKAGRKCTISDATLTEVDATMSCLSWKFDDEVWNARREDDGLPYSDVTGPFSFFVIEVDGQEVRRAYALDYLLREVGDELAIRITGMGFDGEVLCVYTSSLRKRQRQGSTESWQLV